ncbi:MAG: methyltransferase domain-containing protein [Alphaproteobacteria bacterium]|nr:methyltransferase domain-containing protein [Alphaproteobacteria bacterium]
MHHTAYDLRAFYNGKVGRIVRRVLRQRIAELWPDVRAQRVMGCGYATPYLRGFMEDAERVFAVMSAGQGVHHWPYGEKNRVCAAEESAFPVETNSIDRVLMIHGLEFSAHSPSFLQEVFRVLKSNGRLLVVVPNRSGFWAHADWSPFGQGATYSTAQICALLRESSFVIERTDEALFMPPLKYSLFMQSAGFFEYVGRKYLPIAAGVHIIEAGKQLYARAGQGTGLKAPVTVRGLMPRPAASSPKAG